MAAAPDAEGRHCIPAVELSVSQVTTLVNGELLTGGEGVITGFASLRDAAPGELSFFGNDRYAADLRATRAMAVLVPRGCSMDANGAALIAVDNPSAAFGEVVKRFLPPPAPIAFGIHPTAIVDPSAILDRSAVFVGPHVVLEAGVRIGNGCAIGAGSYVGRNVSMGENCWLAPRVTVMDRCVLGNRNVLHSGVVLGADGFGYEDVDGRRQKIDQVGIVQLDDEVEVGANTTIDRARFGRTWIGEGTKIDNQVQIGHNVVVGKHCIIIAQAGIAGSTKVGDYAVIAAQAGISGHLEIGSRTVIAAQSGVTKSLVKPGQYMGFPAGPASEMRKAYAALRRMPDALKVLHNLAKTQGKGNNSEESQNSE